MIFNTFLTLFIRHLVQQICSHNILSSTPDNNRYRAGPSIMLSLFFKKTKLQNNNNTEKIQRVITYHHPVWAPDNITSIWRSINSPCSALVHWLEADYIDNFDAIPPGQPCPHNTGLE